MCCDEECKGHNCTIVMDESNLMCLQYNTCKDKNRAIYFDPYDILFRGFKIKCLKVTNESEECMGVEIVPKKK